MIAGLMIGIGSLEGLSGGMQNPGHEAATRDGE